MARDIEDFIEKSNKAKGFYIGRYEMGKEENTAVCKADKTPYTDVYRGGIADYPGALELSQDMYGYKTQKFASDLISSYAWDTTILFLEKCGDNNNYAFQTRTDNKLHPTGYIVNKDEQCKIFDMAANVYEFTTESSSHTSYPCVYRGSVYYNSDLYSSARNIYYTNRKSSTMGFRPILYIL